jgi:hypothetical protein
MPPPSWASTHKIRRRPHPTTCAKVAAMVGAWNNRRRCALGRSRGRPTTSWQAAGRNLRTRAGHGGSVWHAGGKPSRSRLHPMKMAPAGRTAALAAREFRSLELMQSRTMEGWSWGISGQKSTRPAVGPVRNTCGPDAAQRHCCTQTKVFLVSKKAKVFYT